MLRAVFLALLPSLAIATEAGLFEVNFTTQSLQQALSIVSKTIDQTLLYDPSLMSDFHISAFTGRYSAEEMLVILLQDTHLCAKKIASAWLINTCHEPDLIKKPLANLTSASSKSNIITPEEIIVTGYRDSLAKAREIKRAAVISQDSILAEDIADFPDLNLADALQRVPGISITREAGEGRQISLRGLGPDFTRVTINGIEALGITSSPMDARGAVTRSRAFDFNIFASELFNRINVKKSYSVEMEEGGIGGTVSLATAKPLEFLHETVAVSYRSLYNSNSHTSDPRISLLAAIPRQQWGALLSLTYSERTSTEFGTNTTRWRQEVKEYVGSYNPQLSTQLENAEFWFPRGHRYSVWNNQQRRLGVTTAFQFEPNDNFSSTFNFFYSNLENNLDEHHLAVKNNHQVVDLQWHENNGDKEVIFAKYNNASWRVETRQDYNQSVYHQLSWHTDWQITPKLSLAAIFGSNQSRYSQPKVNKVNIVADNVEIVTDFREDPFYGLSYSPDFDLTNSESFKVKDLYFQENYINSNMENAKLAFTFLTPNDTSLLMGASYKVLANSGHERVKDGFLINTTVPNNTDVLDLGASLSNVFSQHPQQVWLQADLTAVQAFYGVADYRLGEEAIIDASNYQIEEQTSALFASYSFDSQILKKPFTANFGIRWFNTNLTTEGLSAGRYTKLERRYDDFLPSLNMVVDLQPNFLWRFGVSKNISRPSISSLSFSANVSQASREEGDIGLVAVGNPYLEPFKSVNYDSAFEWYFDNQGFFSVAVFFKNIDNFIVEKSKKLPYKSLGLPEELLQVGDSVDDLFFVSKPENSDSSIIKGFELAVSQDFNFLSAPFNQFGIMANYTWADGKTLYRDVQGTGVDQFKTFAGLSEQSYNLTLYYEATDWSARISSAYRSEYILSVQAGNTDQDESGYHATNYIDIAFNYQLTEQFEFTAEALNVTNEREELYSDSNDRAYNTTTSGRTFSIGINTKF